MPMQIASPGRFAQLGSAATLRAESVLATAAASAE